MTTLLEVRDLQAGYGRAEVLHGLSFTTEARSVVTVIGPNGAGKSTLLGALMGLIPSRSGALRFAGEDIARLTLEERVMAGLALVPEKRELFGTMSVEDNLLLGGWRPKSLGERRWRDGLDHASNGPQPLGTGDGATRAFQLAKIYGASVDPYVRPITKPVAGTVSVTIDGVPTGAFTLDDTTGIVTFDTAPPAGAALAAEFEFDVPVRFDTDRLDIEVAAGQITWVGLPPINIGGPHAPD